MTFTSDLTIDEILLVEQAGFEPVELVMGASYFHVGYPSLIWRQNQELTELSGVMYAARHQAMSALDEQARACGADGVVAVRLEVELSGHEAEFVAMGTAVKRRDGRGREFHTAQGGPFTCSLSGEDFWALLHAGMRPVSLAMGVCVYHVANQSIAQWFKQINANVEHEPFTQGLYTARETAMERMQAEAQAAGASGVLDVKVTEHGWSWHSHVMELFAIGTSVAVVPEGIVADMAPVQAVMMPRLAPWAGWGPLRAGISFFCACGGELHEGARRACAAGCALSGPAGPSRTRSGPSAPPSDSRTLPPARKGHTPPRRPYWDDWGGTIVERGWRSGGGDWGGARAFAARSCRLAAWVGLAALPLVRGFCRAGVGSRRCRSFVAFGGVGWGSRRCRSFVAFGGVGWGSRRCRSFVALGGVGWGSRRCRSFVLLPGSSSCLFAVALCWGGSVEMGIDGDWWAWGNVTLGATGHRLLGYNRRVLLDAFPVPVAPAIVLAIPAPPVLAPVLATVLAIVLASVAGCGGGEVEVAASLGRPAGAGVADVGETERVHFRSDPPIAPGEEAITCHVVAVPGLERAWVRRATWSAPGGPVSVHHIMVSAAPPGTSPGTYPCGLATPAGGVLFLFAPGTGDLTLPPGVGLAVPPASGGLYVEAHVLRIAEGQAERTFVELGLSFDAPTHEAGWVDVLGEVPAIAPHGSADAFGSCRFPGEVRVVGSWPHMHRAGRSFLGDVARAGDRRETLVEVASFEFGHQPMFLRDTPVAAGEAVETRCHYQNDGETWVYPGPFSTDEMCNQGLWVWPRERAVCLP